VRSDERTVKRLGLPLGNPVTMRDHVLSRSKDALGTCSRQTRERMKDGIYLCRSTRSGIQPVSTLVRCEKVCHWVKCGTHWRSMEEFLRCMSKKWKDGILERHTSQGNHIHP